MRAALVATLGRPAWWSMALAGFLVRGGILVVLLPIVVLPTPAALANLLAPTIEGFALGGLTPERVLLVLAVAATLFVGVGGAGLAGAWLDLQQLREAADDDDLDLRWEPAQPSIRDALTLRLIAHLPTLAVAIYGSVRLVTAAYDEFLSPGDAAMPIVLRVAARAPEAVAVLVAAWLVGETVGSLAARRSAIGHGLLESLAHSIRQIVTSRGLATLALTTLALAATLVPFLLAAGRAWDNLRVALFDYADFVQVAAALLVLVAWWILGLAVIGAVLAWRAAAWTAEVAAGEDRHAPDASGVATDTLGRIRPLL